MRYLITGATGTLGRALLANLLADPSTGRVVVFSRGEHRQAEIRRDFPDDRLECWIGDVRDRDRLAWALDADLDVVIHAAALKRVEACERNPSEAKKTNIDGTCNVVEFAMRADVPKVIVVSSDKACSPETTYGTTKAAAEVLAIGQNAWRGTRRTRISVVRYGNVLGSQGSVLDAFWKARATGEPLSITDLRATRFWWSVEDAAQFIRYAISQMQGSEIFVPKLVSSKVLALAQAIAPESSVQEVGMRGPEKIHEAMINQTEAAYTWELPEAYVLLPKAGEWWSAEPPVGAIKVPPDFTYRSDQWPTTVELEAVCASA